jgi:hypothetical protein
MSYDVDPDKISAVEPDNDEGVEKVEVKSRDEEQIRRGDTRDAAVGFRTASPGKGDYFFT